jgi:hypothetical protein
MEMDFTRLIKLNADGPQGVWQYSLNIGGFANRADISVWDFKSTERKGPIVKALFTLTSLLQLRLLLDKTLENPDVKPVTLGIWPWDVETKANIFRANITVGRDAEKCIYLEVSGATHKDPIRFYTITDNSVRLNDSELPKQYATELGARSIANVLNVVLPLVTINPRRNAGANLGSGLDIQDARPNDDVPF